jgi:alpha-D-ribose 1-methylphosphonate 5-triphosphate synthase subunit PhnL
VEPLRSLSFDLRAGEFVVVVGPSGSGKSTLLKCIFRTYLPSSGAVRYRLRTGAWLDLATCTEQEILAVRTSEVAYATQFLRCAPRCPAEAVVASARIAQSVPRARALDEARSLLHQFRIPEKLWRAFPVTFSGGEQQRVNLARAIIQRPRLLLLDEPTASLDEASIGVVLQVLREVQEQGTTCLAILHDPALVRVLGSQVIHLPGSHPAESCESEAGEVCS